MIERDKTKVDYTKDGSYKFYPDNPVEEEHKAAFLSKRPSEFYEPCLEASKMSLRCLDRNNYDKSMCTEYFRAYRECKKEWQDKRKQDKREGRTW
jgi:cytochrome c oxidase assembly protein subunit 23